MKRNPTESETELVQGVAEALAAYWRESCGANAILVAATMLINQGLLPGLDANGYVRFLFDRAHERHVSGGHQ